MEQLPRFATQKLDILGARYEFTNISEAPYAMLKVFESFDFSRVGQLQSLLESHDIPTFIKNQFTSSVMGEVPFVEVCPQLFILNDGDLVRAQDLLGTGAGQGEPAAGWVCATCGVAVEGQFSACWRCGLAPSVS